MYLKVLLEKNYISSENLNNHIVTKITTDSRSVIKGSIFVALTDNYFYFLDAVNRGALSIISEYDTNIDFVNCIKVKNIKHTLGLLTSNFYNIKGVNLIGVIGTNGKSTICKILYDYYTFIGIKAMYIGTGYVMYENMSYESTNTTKDITIAYDLLSYAKKHNIRYVFMEVTSIGIIEQRVFGLEFKRLIFTNFSQDHLDYHKTMDNYFRAKSIPFTNYQNISILNSDDSKYLDLANLVKGRVITYGITTDSDCLGKRISLDTFNTMFYYKNYAIKMNLLGVFNVYNVLAILAYLESVNLDPLPFISFLSDYKLGFGRMDLVKKNIIIDYAHNPLAIKNVLIYAKSVTKGEVITIFGAGGERDIKKRPIIGQILSEYSDKIILTNDNPRNEDPLKIIRDIKEGINKEVIEIVSRKDAIKEGLRILKDDDMLLILGKGYENTIISNGKTIKYSDYDFLNELK